MASKEQKMDEVDRMFLTHGKGVIYDEVITSTEKMLIGKALNRSFGNQSIAAKLLGINRNTLRTKIAKLGIEAKKYKI